jgi:hypothetical protein
MKTLNEVKKHCSKNGYEKSAMFKICGWLVAKGIKNEKEIIRYKVGDGTFSDFVEWFESEDEYDFEEMERGECIHVEDGVDVMILSPVYDGEFVGITVESTISPFKITEKSRPCTEEEERMVVNALHEKGVHFCPQCEELEPYYDSFSSANERLNALADICEKEDVLAGNVVLEEIVECMQGLIPCLQAKDALDNDIRMEIIALLEDLAMAMCDSDDEN